jgi:hypothetical protein
MYLQNLCLRQNGKAFFTEDGLGFDRADLTEWWTDGYDRVKAGHVTDLKDVSQVQTARAGTSRASSSRRMSRKCCRRRSPRCVLQRRGRRESQSFGAARMSVQRDQAEQVARYGSDFGSLLLFQAHSRLDAYVAVHTGDAVLAERAWTKFPHSDGHTESSPGRP